MLVMLDKQVSWLFLCWNIILLGSFSAILTIKKIEIFFLKTINNLKHFIFIVTPYFKKKNYIKVKNPILKSYRIKKDILHYYMWYTF